MKNKQFFKENAGPLKRNLSFFMSEVASKNGQKKTSVSFKLQVLFFARRRKHAQTYVFCKRLWDGRIILQSVFNGSLQKPTVFGALTTLMVWFLQSSFLVLIQKAQVFEHRRSLIPVKINVFVMNGRASVAFATHINYEGWS